MRSDAPPLTSMVRQAADPRNGSGAPDTARAADADALVICRVFDPLSGDHVEFRGDAHGVSMETVGNTAASPENPLKDE